MSLEEKLEIFEVLFHRAVKRKDDSGVEFFYNLYNDYLSEVQEYVWYRGLETGSIFIKEVYDEYQQKRTTDYRRLR